MNRKKFIKTLIALPFIGWATKLVGKEKNHQSEFDSKYQIIELKYYNLAQSGLKLMLKRGGQRFNIMVQSNDLTRNWKLGDYLNMEVVNEKNFNVSTWQHFVRKDFCEKVPIDILQSFYDYEDGRCLTMNW